MRVLGFDITWSKKATLTLDQLIQRLESLNATSSGIGLTAENAIQSPTVQAVIRSVGMALASLPIHVLEKTESASGTTKELLPNHPTARLLQRPNEFQTNVTYWLDAVSWLLRYGNYYAFKARGMTGPIRRLQPIPPSAVTVEQDDDLQLTYTVRRSTGETAVFTSDQIHHVRLGARNGFLGDSPVLDARESIALEIAAERFGATFFGNGAMPGLVFKYGAGSAGHKTPEDRTNFVSELARAYGASGRFKAILLPKGMEMEDPISLDNDKAQFLQTRKHQRTVVAGALGIPPHLVGDLERATFSNVEQMSLQFVQMVVLPYARVFEAAMERDLLTDADRAGGVTIRFNLDAALRADFKTRQEGLKIQREMGVINANEWREKEGMNPRDGGDVYFDQGPSGQNQPGGSDAGASAGSESDDAGSDEGDDDDADAETVRGDAA